MTKKYIKFIYKSPYKDQLIGMLHDIAHGDLSSYNLRKLAGHTDLYRIRIGDIRCILQKSGNTYIIKDIHHRGQVYKNI